MCDHGVIYAHELVIERCVANLHVCDGKEMVCLQELQFAHLIQAFRYGSGNVFYVRFGTDDHTCVMERWMLRRRCVRRRECIL